MAGEGGAGARPVTGDNVDHTRRNPGFEGQTCQLKDGRRGVLGRFDHDGVAGGEGRGQFDRGQVQRAVPRNDRGNHTHRFVHGVGKQVGLVQRQGAAFELVGEACGVVEELRQIADLTPGFADQLAVVAAFQLRQLFLVFCDQVTETPQQFAACGGGEAAPGRAVESRLRRLHGAFDVGFIGIGQFGPGLGAGRVEAFEGLAGEGIDPFSADAHLEACECHATIPFIGFCRECA